jgi:3-hydroxyacyl-CoA dehydrogenase/enoyl-CoA hydratase/3-hydroxybutyryl-CoA epimerase
MIDYTVDADGIAVLTIDMPGRSMNVWNRESLAAFAEAVERVASDEGVKGAVVTSGKDAFLAGGDLDTIGSLADRSAGDEEAESADELHDGAGALSVLLRRMETCGKPFVAAMNGAAMGGGFELGLACHHRVLADHSAAKVGLHEATLGLLPGGGGTQRLPRIIGVQSSLGLLMEGKQLRPDKALTMGVVDAVVPAADVVSTAKAWILAGGSPTQPWDKRGFLVPGGGKEDPRTAQTFMVATALLRAKTHDRYPAGLAILSCVREGLQVPFDTGLEIETRYFVSLLKDPVAAAMIRTLFIHLQEANKGARRPKGYDRYTIKTLGVIGAGLMGAGVAYVSAKAGMNVVLLDRDQEAADRGKAYTTRVEDKRITRKRSTEAKRDGILGRITATADYAALANCDFIVEAVFEDRGVKASVTKQAEAVLPERAVFGSNTSTLPITGLAEASARPGNFIGIHFFSPVEKMALVEVIRGEKTSDEALAKTLDYVQAIGKTPIVVNDARGFFTSRVFGTYIVEGFAMLLEGVSPALIENAGKATGMPMPPLALADEVGLSLMYQVGKQTREDLGDDAMGGPSPQVLSKIVGDLGRLGKKSGAGFYDYEDRNKRLWPGLTKQFPSSPTASTDVEELQRRFLYTQAIETARVMEQGVLTAPEDADVGAVMGWGFAPWSGGPLSYIDGIGVQAFVAESDRLAAAYGDRFAVPDLLRTMAAEGTSFY